MEKVFVGRLGAYGKITWRIFQTFSHSNKHKETFFENTILSFILSACSFAQAKEALDLASRAGVEVKDVTRLRENLILRQKEAQEGDYDWERHIRWTKENPGQELDCASFVGPLEIAEIPLKGCGLLVSIFPGFCQLPWICQNSVVFLFDVVSTAFTLLSSEWHITCMKVQQFVLIANW